ncbi:hypothetical protein BaRGS_00024075 [Batillaria attramentaria]|uniref:Uncharacterized protein n=1 Tax=Batillaria attramentaria TaxID=370345 RepID=A0ABD0KC88_9CAEN
MWLLQQLTGNFNKPNGLIACEPFRNHGDLFAPLWPDELCYNTGTGGKVYGMYVQSSFAQETCLGATACCILAIHDGCETADESE